MGVRRKLLKGLGAGGQQLCVLVGDWRIFQRVGGHRWTTDDLVTAWVAGRAYRAYRIAGSMKEAAAGVGVEGAGTAAEKQPGAEAAATSETTATPSSPPSPRILDLGCGNGSILLMLAWHFPDSPAVGVEARGEAVGLARRSVEYNCGGGVEGVGGEGVDGAGGGDGCGAGTRVQVRHMDFRSL
ncbi:hypothetical protein B484DRAFT_423045, partial [Ochromonadaceae sp. CCMP2298]